MNGWVKPEVITCDEITTAQIPQVIEHVCHNMGVESVVFNTRIDDVQYDSNHSCARGTRYHTFEQNTWYTMFF